MFKDFFRKSPDEVKTYHLLIDTFRLRCDDDYTWGQHHHGIYGENPPLPVFDDFLVRAKRVNVLPNWWNEVKEGQCKTIAMVDSYFNIKFATEKSDVQEKWEDNLMPMKMRMAAENIYGGGYGMGQQPMTADYECQC